MSVVLAFSGGSFLHLHRVVKSRLQAGSLKYKSSIDGLLTILTEEGVAGLYKGIGSKIVQSVLTAAILFAGQRRIFEITKKVCSSLITLINQPNESSMTDDCLS